MEEKINKILDLMISGIEKGSELAGEQAGPLFEEYWRYLLADKIIGLMSGLLCFALAYVCYRIAKYSWKKYKESQEKNIWNDEWLWGVIPTVFLLCIFVMSGVAITICEAGKLTKLLVAPKIYVIKAIKNDISGGCGK